MKKILLLLVGLSVILSCNIHLEKRLYNRGYYVNVPGKKNVKPEKINNETANARSTGKDHSIANKAEVRSKLTTTGLPESSKRTPVTNENVLASANSTKSIVDFSGNYFEEGNLYFNYSLSASENDNKTSAKLAFDKKRKKDKNADSYLYWLTGLMGLGAFGLLRKNRSTSLKATRWANKNKMKSRFAIAFMQIALGTLGIAAGKNLSDMGITFSDTSQYLFSGLMCLGFLNLMRDNVHKKIMLFDSFYLRKLSHLIIGMSFFITAIGVGNRMHDKNQITPLGHAIEKVDAGFQPSDPTFEPTTTHQGDGTGGLIVLYVILAILLLMLLAMISCAAWCAGGASIGLPVTIGSIALFIGVVYAMSNSISKRSAKAKASSPAP